MISFRSSLQNTKILDALLESYSIGPGPLLVTLREFPSRFPPNQVAEVGDYHRSVEGCQNGICSDAITEVMKHLPDWVEPHMVYSEGAIEKKEILGHGLYGSVHQGLFHNGNAA